MRELRAQCVSRYAECCRGPHLIGIVLLEYGTHQRGDDAIEKIGRPGIEMPRHQRLHLLLERDLVARHRVDAGELQIGREYL